MTNLKRLGLLVSVVALNFACTRTQAGSIKDKAFEVLKQVNIDLQNNNRSGVIAAVHFPLKIVTAKKTETISNGVALEGVFESVFSKSVRIIFETQEKNELIVNSSGVGLWRGTVWMDSFSGNLKIKSVRIDMIKKVGQIPDYSINRKVMGIEKKTKGL